MRRGHRTRRDQPAPSRVDDEVQPFERVRAEELRVSRLGEDDLVDREVPVQPDDREADAARDVLAVGEDEGDVLLLASDAEPLEGALGDPGELASRVDEQLRHDGRSAAIDGVLDLALHVEAAHRATSPGCPHRSPPYSRPARMAITGHAPRRDMQVRCSRLLPR
ncbi:MAG TPA: hypothetical protein VMS22_15685 [Candidatus Eisenbacteria bacterium]|nr:hypothetical protein [Candidatus Eisenbacteria bacterium]